MSSPESQKFGLISMILLGINAIIGSGIFLLPGKVSELAGGRSGLVYIFITFLSLAIAWCFAQCASRFSRNGGAYVYAKEAFGEFIGFEIGIMRWAVGIIAWASMAVGFLTVLGSIWPEAQAEPLRSILLIMLVGSLGILNALGIKRVKGLNNTITISKLLPLIFFIMIGIFFVKQSNFSYQEDQLVQNVSESSFGAASLVLFYAFGGFETLAVAAEDMKNPKKNLPIALMVVISTCAGLYFLIQIIATGLLGAALPSSEAPIADSVEVLLGPVGKFIVTIVMLISVGGINVAASFLTPRAGVALAEDRLVPAVIAEKNRFGTPYLAILITVIFTGCVALSGNFTELVTISVVSRFSQYISTCIASVVFNRSRLSTCTLAEALLILFVPFVALCGLTWLLFHASVQQIILGFSALILGVPLYFLQKWAINKPLVAETAES